MMQMVLRKLFHFTLLVFFITEVFQPSTPFVRDAALPFFYEPVFHSVQTNHPVKSAHGSSHSLSVHYVSCAATVPQEATELRAVFLGLTAPALAPLEVQGFRHNLQRPPASA